MNKKDGVLYLIFSASTLGNQNSWCYGWYRFSAWKLILNGTDYLNLNILSEYFCNLFIFQTLTTWSSRIFSLKYQRSTTFLRFFHNQSLRQIGQWVPESLSDIHTLKQRLLLYIFKIMAKKQRLLLYRYKVMA